MQLVCPAGSLPALRAAVDAGADAVYLGFSNATNARHFPGLNFDVRQMHAAVEYAHAAKVKVLLAMNTYPGHRLWETATQSIALAVELGVDAIIMADAGLLHYTASHYPSMRLHLSVQASATTVTALTLYQREFNIQRAVLPRVLSLAQVAALVKNSPVEIEVFAFGSLCIMVEGRCYLSSYVTGESPNGAGVCSPAKAVRWYEHKDARWSRLNGVMIDCYGARETAGYPTLCKGRFYVNQQLGHALEQPVSLNILDILPQLHSMGVTAIKIEGRQRSPAYVRQVTRVMRQALDSCQRDTESYYPQPQWFKVLDGLAEGGRHTLGAYDRPWQ